MLQTDKFRVSELVGQLAAALSNICCPLSVVVVIAQVSDATAAHNRIVLLNDIVSLLGQQSHGTVLNEQFLWRIMGIVKAYELKDVTLGLFSKPTWMTGDAFEDFRKEWEQMATYESGFAFHSEEFEGLTSGWAIHFSVWTLSA